MNYKIQTIAFNGWADLKECIDDSGDYQTSIFASLREARAELKDLITSCDCDPSDWRIVSADTPAECDVYS
jgi:hypothetical protein